MLRVSRLTDYALVLLTQLAQNTSESVSAQTLATDTRLHLPMASKALKALSRAGWVESQRGQQGGYRLSRPANDIPILAVVELFEGPIALAPCQTEDVGCELQQSCQMRPHWHLINTRLRGELEKLSVAELTRPPRRESIIHEY